MKKCPITLQWIGGTQLKGDITAGGPCIGAECAAYVERGGGEVITYGKMVGPLGGVYGKKTYSSIEKKQWSCAMMPRENWIDVETKND